VIEEAEEEEDEDEEEDTGDVMNEEEQAAKAKGRYDEQQTEARNMGAFQQLLAEELEREREANINQEEQEDGEDSTQQQDNTTTTKEQEDRMVTTTEPKEYTEEETRAAIKEAYEARLIKFQNKRRALRIGVRYHPSRGRQFTTPDPVAPEALKYTQYYDMSIVLHEHELPREHLFLWIELYLQELFTREPTAKIYAFKEELRATVPPMTIENWNSIIDSDSLEQLQTYFHKATPYWNGGGKQTLRILMTHKKKFTSITTEMGGYFYKNGGGLYIKTLQVPESIVAGWAYMSTGKINKEKLTEELSRWCGFPVGLQWRDMTHEGLRTKNSEVKALHFEVEKATASADRRVICSIYRWDRKRGWPLGMRMRYVPDMAHGLNATAKKMIDRLRRKQANMRYMVHLKGENFTDIDLVSPAIGNQSIRTLMMGMQSRYEPNTPLFTALNKHWEEGDNLIWVSCLPQVETEAKAVGLRPQRWGWCLLDPCWAPNQVLCYSGSC
jgi:hypothetical protein